METPSFLATFLQDFFDTMLFLINGFIETASLLILGGFNSLLR